MNAFELLGPESGDVLLVTDHASNAIPPELNGLGLTSAQLGAHIAIDIGAAEVTRHLVGALGCRAVMAGFSRLFVDANRAEGNPGLIVEQSDGIEIPGNIGLGAADREGRLESYYRPYHRQIQAEVDALAARHVQPMVLALHSFTPHMNGHKRPWHIGLLYNRDERLANAAKAYLAGRPDIVVGDNEPYTGKLYNNTLDVHAQARGLPHLSIELRQDLIADADGARVWGRLLEKLIGAFRAAL